MKAAFIVQLSHTTVKRQDRGCFKNKTPEQELLIIHTVAPSDPA